MRVRPMDIAPVGPVALPDSGLGKGWEGATLIALTALLLSVGLVTVYSTSSVLALRQDLPDTYYVVRQAAGAAIGFGILAVCALLPYRIWARLAWPLIWASLLMLLVLVLPGTQSIAPEINGARRWLRLGVTIQPSEFAKIAVIAWTAHMAVRKAPHFRSLSRGLGPFFPVWGAILALVALEPDLSTACVILFLGLVVVFAAGARIGHFVFLALPLLLVLKSQFEVGFRAARLTSFLNPATDPSGAGFQVRQSLVALGSGGVSGVGFGQGRQKFGFLPEAHNDFIFAMVGEEWGLLGVALLVALYASIILIGFRIAARAPDLFGELLAVGFTSLIAVQAVLHMSVNLGLLPATGLSLPLVSYGRSNMMVTFLAIGVLVSIARARPDGRGGRA